MTRNFKHIDSKNLKIYKYTISIILGFVGFIGIFYSTRFDFNGFSINFAWSIILPLLVTLAWGIRYGIISITLGMMVLYPFILGGYNGWASIVPTISLYLWIVIHGYGSQKRQHIQSFHYNIYFLQFIYIILRMVIYMTLFPILISFNPPFWNPEAYTEIEFSIVLIFAIKGIIVESIFLALCDALLLLPVVRKFFRLKYSKGAKYNTKIMLALVVFGLLFTLVTLTVHNVIIDKTHPILWLIEPNEKTRITFLLAGISFFIIGGVTLRFVQRVFETQEALRKRERQYQRAIREIKILNDELEQRVLDRTVELQDAVSELEEFTYTVSHDLKSPLRAIDGYSKFILEDFGNSLHNEVVGMIGSIQTTCEDMIELINKLLEYSITTQSSISIEKVNIKSMLTTVFHELEIGNPDKKMELTFETDIPTVMVDKLLFKQVVTNILSNSVKFSKQDQTIKIAVACTQSQNEYIFSVKDNGVGFDMKYSKKLFGIFQRLHRSQDFEGAGIGLATIKKIIKKHKGRVWIESILNEGTTIYFTIPIDR